MTWYREWFGEEYLELYAHRDEKEAEQQIRFLKAQLDPIRGRLLDLACGSGRHVQELIEQKFDVIGCDLSFVLLRAGQADYGSMPVVRADMRLLPFADGTFAGLVNFFTSFGYFSEEDENLQVVREMARVLSPGAPFLFDYLNIERELANLQPREEKHTEAGKVGIDRWFDKSSRTLNKRITTGGKRFIERVRAYDLDEISTLFASSGFVIRKVFGDFEANGFDSESPRMIVVGYRR